MGLGNVRLYIMFEAIADIFYAIFIPHLSGLNS